MRMSSEMFPFASHDKYGYDLSYVDKELKEVGDLAKNYGHRLTMHPGQVCVMLAQESDSSSSQCSLPNLVHQKKLLCDHLFVN